MRGTQVVLPKLCVVCGKPLEGAPGGEYPIERIFTYGRNTITIKFPVPLCAEHLALAKAKSRAEIFFERVGLYGGILVGLLIFAGLLLYWADTGQGSLILNVLLAGVVGVGFFLIVWISTKFWLAPAFASSETKAARNSVRLLSYAPMKDVLELAFSNATLAEQAALANAAKLVNGYAGKQAYHLEGFLNCADVRLITTAKIDVFLDHKPTEREALSFLWPVADEIVARNFCEGCLYHLDITMIEQISG